MKLRFVDTSVLVAIALGEPGHRRFARLLGAADVVLASALLEAELASALHREGVEGASAMLERIDWILPDRRLTPELVRILEAGTLRGADLWHLATALYAEGLLGPLEFVSADRDQSEVARRLGLATA